VFQNDVTIPHRDNGIGKWQLLCTEESVKQSYITTFYQECFCSNIQSSRIEQIPSFVVKFSLARSPYGDCNIILKHLVLLPLAACQLKHYYEKGFLDLPGAPVEDKG
jgi:hypothetical protein